MKRNIPNGIAEFILVVQLGSFSAAAQQLNLSRARISQIISLLEQEVGVQLLHRSTRSLSLTSAGEAFFERSLRGLEQITYAVETARDSHSAISGVIRINSVGGYFGEQILAPVLIRFMLLHPGIKIQLSFSSVRVDIIDEKLDLVLRMGELEDSSLISRKLATYQNHVLASPKYLRDASPLETPHDLPQHNLINGSIPNWKFIHKSSKQSITIEVESILQCPNGHVAMNAAVDGLGITRQPGYYLNSLPQTQALVSVLPEWKLLPTTLSLLYPKARYAQPRIQALIDYLLKADLKTNI